MLYILIGPSQQPQDPTVMPSFTDGKTEAQKGSVTGPRSQRCSQWDSSTGLLVTLPGARARDLVRRKAQVAVTCSNAHVTDGETEAKSSEGPGQLLRTVRAGLGQSCM